MHKILLVEDDKSLSVGLVYYLNKEGYHVIHTETIKETREVLTDNDFDIAILDVTLPDGNSYELVPDLNSRRTPVVFLTALDEEKDILKGFDLGAEDYITKPFHLKVLNARIKLILKRNEEEFSNTRESGDLVVDIPAVKVYKKGKLIDLTQTEYKLLNYFMDNYNVALSRDKLLEFLWDSDADFQSYSTIAVYVNRLRDKLGDHSTPPKYIATKRGFGYMWVSEVK
ncbi:response regulator transcription factor [Helcococcus sueciensis]|uniref:response regulator transcription factor n=1 Tax=Helcococcus sueciensis TaxID=241555 RepID=UPI0004211092|nr:response regulator transcription factor [Helcococcus sueciensis]